MTAATVSRRDITLEEEVELEDVGYAGTRVEYSWMAKLEGWLSTGERVEMERGGKTSAEARSNLEAAIVEQGWEIR